MFWFTYLITNFYIAGSTFLEAITSLTPIRNARKAVQKVEDDEWVFPKPDDELLVLDLLIVGTTRACSLLHFLVQRLPRTRSPIFPMKWTS